MEMPVLNASYRAQSGTNSAHRARNLGQVPGVIYDANLNKLIEVDKKELDTVIHHYGENAMVNVNIGEQSVKTMIKDIQYHPVNQQVIHIDFKPVSDSTRVRTRVPVRFIGVPEAERHGGIIQKQKQEIEVECVADKVPKFLNADLSQLEVGDNFKVQDMEFAEELTLLTKPNEVLALLIPKSNYVEQESGEEAKEQ